MNFHVLTLFPEMIEQGLSESITGRALKQNIISLDTVNIRDFANNKHNKVDDYTYGGGAGMLMQAEPVYGAIKSVTDKIKHQCRVIYVTPQGKRFDQHMAMDFAGNEDLVFLCGHYEGIDERVLEETVTDYVSIGDYVLTGGELAAMVMIDAIARLVPGVLHNDISAETESFHGKLLEYPQYSRPFSWHGKEVPAVLMSGNQKQINAWRLEQSIMRTKQRRPDLYDEYQKLSKCREFLLDNNKLLHMDMIELINRGRAEIIYGEDDEYLLRDINTGIGFHTKPEGAIAFAFDMEDNMKPACIILHQTKYIKQLEEAGYNNNAVCKQAVWTRREKMPARGLYKTDAGITEDGYTIKLLGRDDFEAAAKLYKGFDGDGYLYDRIMDGAVYGAFDIERLIGVIGLHEEGSIGMLSVDPEYRRKKLAMALETYIFNLAIEKGQIPYSQVIVGNEASMALQKKLGLYFSKTDIVWMENKKISVEK